MTGKLARLRAISRGEIPPDLTPDEMVTAILFSPSAEHFLRFADLYWDRFDSEFYQALESELWQLRATGQMKRLSFLEYARRILLLAHALGEHKVDGLRIVDLLRGTEVPPDYFLASEAIVATYASAPSPLRGLLERVRTAGEPRDQYVYLVDHVDEFDDEALRQLSDLIHTAPPRAKDFFFQYLAIVMKTKEDFRRGLPRDEIVRIGLEEMGWPR